jgi:hypothetical protein
MPFTSRPTSAACAAIAFSTTVFLGITLDQERAQHVPAAKLSDARNGDSITARISISLASFPVCGIEGTRIQRPSSVVPSPTIDLRRIS